MVWEYRLGRIMPDAKAQGQCSRSQNNGQTGPRQLAGKAYAIHEWAKNGDKPVKGRYVLARSSGGASIKADFLPVRETGRG